MERVKYEIRPLKENEWEMAMQLVWDTFLIYEAPEFTKEGVGRFHDFIHDPRLKGMFINGDYSVYAALNDNTIIGVLGTRGQHISLLFVEPEYHHQGIATALLNKVFTDVRALGCNKMSVNASPYAVSFYKKRGFVKVSSEIARDGIRITPMKIDF